MRPFVSPSDYDVLIFEHIPKTAGSTLRIVLWNQFGAGHVVHTNMRDPGPRTEELRQRILTGRPLRAISSHIGYGLHERLPGDLRYAHITMLRHPLDRTLSHYYYALERGNIDAGTTLVEFCRSDGSEACALRAWTCQTAYLSGSACASSRTASRSAWRITTTRS
jgi:hypothetical protein